MQARNSAAAFASASGLLPTPRIHPGARGSRGRLAAAASGSAPASLSAADRRAFPFFPAAAGDGRRRGRRRVARRPEEHLIGLRAQEKGPAYGERARRPLFGQEAGIRLLLPHHIVDGRGENRQETETVKGANNTRSHNRVRGLSEDGRT